MIHVALGVVSIVLGATSASHAQVPQSLNLDVIRAIPLQHDGRWPPLDTVARDLVNTVTGDVHFQGNDPVALLLAWTFDSARWMEAPLISIANAELRRELQLSDSKTLFSFSELVGHAYLRSLIEQSAQMSGDQKPDPLQAKVADIEERLMTLQRIFAGQVILAIPNGQSAGDRWLPITAPKASSPEPLQAVQRDWASVATAFRTDDAPAFATASQAVAASLSTLPAAYRPADARIATELQYNSLRPFRTAWQIMLFGALLAAAAMVVKRRTFDVVVVIGMVAGFAMVSYGLWLRWTIAGRIPASNMFESLLFLSWGMGAFAILSMFVMRHRMVPLTASAMGAVALMLADLLPMNQFIRPIPPVLADTIWMSIHVPIIMVSYSVLALGVLVAHVQLVVMAAVPRHKTLIRNLDNMHYWYIHVGSFLLLAGIITGSMWGASSWGRYWGWDPKEVWSLVAALGYLTILHVRTNHERIPRWAYLVAVAMAVGLFAIVAPKLAPLSAGKVMALFGAAGAMVLFVVGRGELATALKSIVCFWLILMTYLGVNYVLGSGLHSYGFGTGAVARQMLTTGSVDLGLVALCSLFYLVRRGGAAPAGVPVSLGAAV